MAVRVYPTFDPNNPVHVSAIEQIAQVPAGTYAAVQAYRAGAQRLAHAGGDAGFQHWDGVQGTPVGVLDAFLTYGWGRQTPNFRVFAEGAGDPDCGAADDPAVASALLLWQGVEEPARQLVLQRELGIAWH